MYAKALGVAMKAHRGQLDKGGKPYIGHVMRVANGLEGKAEIVALLHDVVEDSGVELADLAGFGLDVYLAVGALTKLPGEDYFDYLDRVKANDLALIVKLRDLADNRNESRIKSPSVADRARYLKYTFADGYLRGKIVA